jgi:hypothetical protein
MAPHDVERAVFHAEMALPHDLAVHVERDELARPEPGVDHLSVADRARAGEIALVVNALKRTHGFEAMLPQWPPIVSMEGLDHEDRFVTRGSGEEPLPCAARGIALREPRVVALATDTRSEL